MGNGFLASVELCFHPGKEADMKKYIVELTREERRNLKDLVNGGKSAAFRIKRANILLKVDEGKHGPGWKDEQVAEAFDCGTATLERLRKRWVERGTDEALERETRGPQLSKLDGDAEAVLVATACSDPPAGRAKWTVRLLADKLVELGVVDSCSHMTVQRAMKKTC
jgi:transposase